MVSDFEGHRASASGPSSPTALTVCAREAVKLMREFGIDDGNIININSCSGHRVAPGILHFYTATKVTLPSPR